MLHSAKGPKVCFGQCCRSQNLALRVAPAGMPAAYAFPVFGTSHFTPDQCDAHASRMDLPSIGGLGPWSCSWATDSSSQFLAFLARLSRSSAARLCDFLSFFLTFPPLGAPSEKNSTYSSSIRRSTVSQERASLRLADDHQSVSRASYVTVSSSVRIVAEGRIKVHSRGGCCSPDSPDLIGRAPVERDLHQGVSHAAASMCWLGVYVENVAAPLASGVEQGP